MKLNDAGRIAAVLAAVVVFAYLFLQTSPPWETYGSSVAIDSVLAFLAVVAAASASSRVRIDPSLKHRLVFVALVYVLVIHVGDTLDHLSRADVPVVYGTPAGILLDLLETTTLAVFLLLAYHLRGEESKGSFARKDSVLTLGLLLAALTIYGLAFYVTQTVLSGAITVAAGYVLGATALVAYTLLFLTLNRQRVDWSTHDPVRLAMAGVLFGASALVLMLVLPQPSQLWIAAIVFQAAGLVFMNLGTGYPFLVDVGVKRWIAYMIIISLSVFVIVPFVAAQLFVSIFSLGENWTSEPELGATVLTHLSAAVFTSVVGIVLYSRSRNGTSWYHSPIVFLLFSWTILESSIVFFRFYPVYGTEYEPFVPYVIGGLVSAITLVVAVRRILSPPCDAKPTLSIRLHLAGYVSVVGIVILGEIIKSWLFTIEPGLLGSDVGEIIMISTAFVSVFALVTFVMLMAAETGGQYSVESVAVSSQALWIISIILRANFDYWTVGWWAAELILLSAVIVLHLTMTYLYLDKNNQAQQLKSRTRIYSDVVGSDILDHHAETLSLLKSMGEERGISESSRASLSQAMMRISHASDLTRAVHGFVGGESFGPKDLQSIDAIDCINLAVTRMSKAMPDKRVEVKTDCETGRCFVNANNLLVDLFFSLLRGLLRRTQATLPVSATMTAVFENSRRMWQIRMSTQAARSEVKMTRNLFERYLETDKSEGLDFALVRELARLFNGRVYIESREYSEEREEITFVVVLPAAEVQ